MNKYYYKHLSNRERRKLQSLICNKPILKPIFGTTDHWWNIVNWKWLIKTDNGSEFYDWKRFKRSIYSAKEDIDVYFCHSYASWEKGGVENFNGLIRKDYSKDFDFSTISQDEIDNEIKKINEIYRETLRYYSAKERYNELSLINWAL